VIVLVAGTSAARNRPANGISSAICSAGADFAGTSRRPASASTGDLVASVFSAAFVRWVAPGQTGDLVELQREALALIGDLAHVETV
jgi:hypothetical protein